MFLDIIIILALIVYVEAITEIVTTSSLFFEFRAFLSKKSKFLSKLVSCGYCFSVWASLTVAWIFPIKFVEYGFFGEIVNFIIAALVLHRTSNIMHHFVSRHQKGAPLFGSYVEVGEDIDVFEDKSEEAREDRSS